MAHPEPREQCSKEAQWEENMEATNHLRESVLLGWGVEARRKTAEL